MAVSERVHRAASRILDGDDSITAARALEAVLTEEALDGTTELLKSLARYGHEDVDPYVHAQEVREVLMDTLEQLSHRVTEVELARHPEGWSFTVLDGPEVQASGTLPIHTRDFASARSAAVAHLRHDHPRVLLLRWSATGNQTWTGHLPGTA